MSLTKVEKEKENDLAASISGSMTVDKLKNALTQNKIVYSTAKKKADFVDLYISNGLHNKPIKSLEEEAISSVRAKEAEAKVEEPVVKEEKEEVLSANEIVAKSLEEEDLVMSITIMGHGCEDLLTPWPDQLPISTYFKNNVRVYSKACVPDVNAIGNRYQNEDIIKDVQRRFSNVPKGETAAIIDEYAKDVKVDYMRNIESLISSNYEMVKTPAFKKLSAQENLSKASSLSTYLANKNFSFYNDDPNEKVTGSHLQHLYKTLGLQVTDIRLKRTAMDGSVTYEQIFNPRNLISDRPTDIANHNLIYREGLTYILKNVLNRKELVKPALQIFGFKGRQDRVMDLSLEQIYDFFQLVGVKYANIMDYSCRTCSVGRIPQSVTDRIYRVEQKYSVKPVAFGKRSDGKRSDGKRSDGKRSDGKRSDGKRSDGKQSDGKRSDGKRSDGKRLKSKRLKSKLSNGKLLKSKNTRKRS